MLNNVITMLNNAITPLNNAITTIKQRYNNAITMVNNDSSFKYYFNSCFNRVSKRSYSMASSSISTNVL